MTYIYLSTLNSDFYESSSRSLQNVILVWLNSTVAKKINVAMSRSSYKYGEELALGIWSGIAKSLQQLVAI